MIDHSNCDHDRTKTARARCRRGVPPITEDLNHGTTPRDLDKQCMNCGVEKIVMRGTDPVTGRMMFVGMRCEYLVRHATDLTPID